MPPKVTSKATSAQVAEHLRNLRKNEPIPKEIFHAMVPLIWTVPIEFGLVKKTGDRQEVLMVQRPSDDKEWPPGSWHLPGTVLIGYDRSPEEGVARVIANEISCKMSKPVFLGVVPISRELAPTRPALSILYSARLIGKYEGRGKFFDVRDLPRETLAHHRPLIAALVEALAPRF